MPPLIRAILRDAIDRLRRGVTIFPPFYLFQPELHARDLITKGPWVDVRKFGAWGDGDSHPLRERFSTPAEAQRVYPLTDALLTHSVPVRVLSLDDEIDWAAIQEAILYAGIQRYQGGRAIQFGPGAPRWQWWRQNRPDQLLAVFGSVPTVYFPAGHYLISEYLEIHADHSLRGDNAIIEQTDHNKPIIFTKQSLSQLIEHLAFIGGRNAISINTQNNDTVRITIQNCQFQASSSYAIYTEYSNSTLLTIKDCKFMYCQKVFRNACDIAHIERCWITTAGDMVGAEFDNHGGLHMKNVFATADGSDSSGAEPHFIDNFGSVHLLECNVGRHGGKGFVSIVDNFACTPPYPGAFISIVNSNFDDVRRINPQRLGAAIRLFQLPNIIEVVGNTGWADTKLISVDPGLDLTRLNKDYNYDEIKITISGNVVAKDINAIEQYEKLTTFLNRDLFEGAERHSDNVSNLFHYPDDAPNTDLSPDRRITPQGWHDPAGAGYIPQRRDGPYGMDATRISSGNLSVVLDIALDFVEGHIERQKEQQGQQRGGIYTFSVFVRTRKAKVALTAFGKKITAFKISPLWSRLSGSFYFDGVLPDLRDHTTSLGFTFAFDDPDDSFVDVCGPSLNEGHIPSPYVLPGNNWIVTSPETAPIYWGPRGWATEDPQTRTWRPIAGSWRKGDIVYNENAQAGGFIGWVCVADGTPGEWRGFGRID